MQYSGVKVKIINIYMIENEIRSYIKFFNYYIRIVDIGKCMVMYLRYIEMLYICIYVRECFYKY